MHPSPDLAQAARDALDRTLRMRPPLRSLVLSACSSRVFTSLEGDPRVSCSLIETVADLVQVCCSDIEHARRISSASRRSAVHMTSSSSMSSTTSSAIYCDGVFDMLHIGHMAQFRKALEVTDGDYLLVGVMNDNDCVKYKRKPVMSEEERYATVEACAFVNEVVRDAPEKITEELLTKHRIDFVAAGEEYADVAALEARGAYDYYAVPRAKNMLKFTTRTAGVSTSDIIKRIRSRSDLEPRVAESAEQPSAADSAASERGRVKKEKRK